jgi:hypothetical protein
MVKTKHFSERVNQKKRRNASQTSPAMSAKACNSMSPDSPTASALYEGHELINGIVSTQATT